MEGKRKMEEERISKEKGRKNASQQSLKRYAEFVAWWMPLLLCRSPEFRDDVPDALLSAARTVSIG